MSMVYEYIVPIEQHETLGKDQEFIIRGTAINATTTRNDITYEAEELKLAAKSLKGKPLLKDHKNLVDSVIGRVIGSDFYNDAVQFSAIVLDQQMKEKIKQGLITSVSVGAMVHTLHEDGSQKIAKGIEFVELSLVAIPADPAAGIYHHVANTLDAAIVQESIKPKKKRNQESKENTMEKKTITQSEVLKELKTMLQEVKNMQQQHEAVVMEELQKHCNISYTVNGVKLYPKLRFA